MLITFLFLFFLQSVSPKNLDRVENPSPEEKIPLSCRSEEECEYLQRERVGRSNEDAGLHKRQVNCGVLPEQEDRLSCEMFMGKREELEGNYARRGGFVNPLLRTIPNQPKCTKVWCRYNPGKKKFMVKKAVRATGRQSNAGVVSSDTSKKPCVDFRDLLCGSSGGGIGRKRSIPQSDPDNCSDPEYSDTEECRWALSLGKRAFSS